MAKRRVAAETRKALLTSARAAFTSRGFDEVGLRDITGAVGLNVSLVNRYFGSKERLFAEAMRVALGFDTIGAETASGVPAALASYALDASKGCAEFDPMLIVLRSAPVEKARPILRDFLAREAIAPLAERIGGEAATERASLIVGFLLGIIMMRGILECDPLTSSTRNDLALLIEEVIATATNRMCPGPPIGVGCITP